MRRLIAVAVMAFALLATAVIPTEHVTPATIQASLAAVAPDVIQTWFDLDHAEAWGWASVWSGIRRVGHSLLTGASVFGAVEATGYSVGCAIGYATGFGASGCNTAGGALAVAALPVASVGFFGGFVYGLF